ncbi:permease prefix domain 1-containing protein [Agromyces sp. LHK192]|uniref:permease prefix domain 1-containing protein n=1 Tax=Agromyces sp. LHK192 TaxID=2498704 RepID=UPI000FDB189B|nr:permease prefix domain 1-containing protein [Agromyces sp. LHK192]
MTASSLTDRYVWAAVRTARPAQRTELDRELRERIGDDIDARIEQGEQPAAAEHAALTDLGDPAAVAAGYIDRPLMLIGPRYYLAWQRLLKLLLAIVLPFAALGITIGQVVAGTPAGGIVGAVIGSTITVGIHVAFWTTLLFVVLERLPDTARSTGKSFDWSLDMLPEVPDPAATARRGELIGSLVFLGLFAAAIVLVQVFGIPWVPALDGEPLFDPDLWSFWLPYFLVLIGLEAIFAVVLYQRGWNWWLATVNLILNLAFVVPALWLFLSGQLIAEGALEAMRWPWGDSGPVIVTIVVVAVIAAAVWDVVDGAVKAYRAQGVGR